MKRTLLLIVSLLAALHAVAATAAKQTLLYAVKDADSLFLDHYVADVEGRRPCMIFVFGGGFAGGVRDNKQYIPYFEFLNDNGYDVVSIDYRLGLKDVKGRYRHVGARDGDALQPCGDDGRRGPLQRHALRARQGRRVECRSRHDRIVRVVGGAITVLQAEYALCNRTEEAAVMPETFDYAGVVSFAGAVFSVDGAPEWARKPAPVMMFHGSADNQVPFEKASVFGVGFFGSKFLVKQFDKQAGPTGSIRWTIRTTRWPYRPCATSITRYSPSSSRWYATVARCRPRRRCAATTSLAARPNSRLWTTCAPTTQSDKL